MLPANRSTSVVVAEARIATLMPCTCCCDKPPAPAERADRGDAGGGELGDTVDNRRNASAPSVSHQTTSRRVGGGGLVPVHRRSQPQYLLPDSPNDSRRAASLRCWFASAAASASAETFHQFAGHVRQADAGAQHRCAARSLQDRVVVGRRPRRQRWWPCGILERPPRRAGAASTRS